MSANNQFGGYSAQDAEYSHITGEYKEQAVIAYELKEDTRKTTAQLTKAAFWISTVTSTVSASAMLWNATYNPNFVGEGTILYYALIGLTFGISAIVCHTVDFRLIDKNLKWGISLISALFFYGRLQVQQYVQMFQFLFLGFAGVAFTVFTSYMGAKEIGKAIIKDAKPKTVTSALADLRKEHQNTTLQLSAPIMKKLEGLDRDYKLAVERKLGKNLAKDYLKGNGWAKGEAELLGISTVEKEFEAKRKNFDAELATIQKKASTELDADEKLITKATQTDNIAQFESADLGKDFLFWVGLIGTLSAILLTITEAVQTVGYQYAKDAKAFREQRLNPRPKR